MTWLNQREPGPNVILLEDYPGKVVYLGCQYCDRSERHGLAGLVRRFGPAAGLSDVLEALSADCSRWQDRQIAGPCGASFPDLVPRPPT